MGISAATFEQAIVKTEQQMEQLGPAMEHVRQVVNKQLSKLIWPLGAGLKWAWNKCIGLAQKFRELVVEMLKNAQVPFIFDRYEDRWLAIGSDAVEAASTMQKEVNDNGKRVWGGLAGGAYQEGVKEQPVAMDAIMAKANAISGACTDIRNAGYGFYIGMSIAVVSAIAALVTVETIVGAIAGLVVAIAAIVGAVATLLLETHSAKQELSANLGPGRSFPGNAWPPATTS
ncbi:hypothetical protein [Actinomadura violacea]|uniref:WXG100 family type VII secretion target n=1 Tax=Actinomadura violacea TaxID=2819934 RepID=A0ABS3RTZ6_9ACTN|nr:hypothetical protein [Actinomadura violacea]MBO2460229.1 hypothetical protein [Actinomadura violacea]